MNKLVFESEGKRHEIALSNRPLSLGRSDEADYQLPTKLASRIHAQVFPRERGWWVEDLGSSNGTVVNGNKIGKPMPLVPGDIITLGDVELKFEGAAPAPAGPPDHLVARILYTPEKGKAPVETLIRDRVTIGRKPENTLVIDNKVVSGNHLEIINKQGAYLMRDLGSSNGTFLNGERLSVARQLQDGDKITLGSTTVLKFTYHDKLDEDFQRQMFDAALRDGLTQAYNKKYFSNHLYSEFSFAKRHRQELCLVMLDVDHFKDVNDTSGHLAGDAVLVKLAKIAMDSIRVEDTLARYGGEEFAIVGRGINGDQGVVMAERIRQVVERTRFEHDGVVIPVTVSLGVAAFPEIPVETPDQLVGAADAALYRAKHEGRNRTELAR